MKLSTISLLYIWSSIASTQAGIIARTINDSQNEVNKITHTERAERPREYTPNSKTNSKCNSKNKLPEKPKGNHRSHQKYSKEAWSSDLNASKHDESSGSQDAHINDTDNRVPEIGIDFQRKKEVDLTKLHNQRNRLGSEEIHGSKQGAESIDSIEIVLRKGSNTDGGRSKIKEIEITLHSSNPESTAAEDNISIELTTNGLVRELGHSKGT
ncbi:hypothetical protein K493DRAFT_313900 [Basidiobolus meristosporus CBS 931.73]|uniref:Uncharacterized protein n=1 Tax=Basidiobolus meristosporus CBS 931.73 TaxID=1314790 RepID=A0A1Y1YIQ2_9FUNG|nr:hypothetical protein K493DRAFT_313900 [Basidiobolus meristosporus CBS 931.73]|eukprot:ORX97890.1 hypothetical protein K493DRAFT_313900 [Basidiobolus meristosporus CBS 931.73]